MESAVIKIVTGIKNSIILTGITKYFNVESARVME